MTQTLAVLLIEDTPEFAALVHEWLSVKRDIAFMLTWADSLTRGLNRLRHGQVDVVVLDLELPDSKGYETFRTVKTHAPAIPVIVVSAGDGESLALRMVQEGAQDYIIKSICNGEMLSQALRYEVARHRVAIARFLRGNRSDSAG